MSSSAPGSEPRSELADAASRLGAIAVEGVHLRLELFALELAEERRRLGASLVTALATAFAALMAILAFNTMLLMLFWETHRVEMAVGMFLFYAALAVALGLYHRRFSHRASPPFAATLEVLARDQQALRGQT